MFTYTLIRSRRTTIQISILPNKTIIVRAPLFAPRQKIDEIVASKEKWIAKKMSTRTTDSARSLNYDGVPGETILYLGKSYILRVASAAERPAGRAEQPVCCNGNDLIVRSRNKTAPAVQRTVETWLRRQALTVFMQILNECWIHFSQKYPDAVRPELSIRTMKTRWGSLSQQRGRRTEPRPPHMTLNTLLIGTEPYCIRQVVYHELCHIIHPNHRKAFYEALAFFVPDYQETKKRMEETYSLS